jgi:competence protein ComEA
MDHVSSNRQHGKKRQKQKGGSMKRLLLTFVMWFAICGIALAAVNINTATKDELLSLKGVGDKRAQAIIDYRTKNGPFKTVDDLEKVPGVGPGLMKQIRPQISVSGPTSIEKPGSSTKAKTTTEDKKTTKSTDSTKNDSTKNTKASDSAKGKSDTKSAKKSGE